MVIVTSVWSSNRQQSSFSRHLSLLSLNCHVTHYLKISLPTGMIKLLTQFIYELVLLSDLILNPTELTQPLFCNPARLWLADHGRPSDVIIWVSTGSHILMSCRFDALHHYHCLRFDISDAIQHGWKTDNYGCECSLIGNALVVWSKLLVRLKPVTSTLWTWSRHDANHEVCFRPHNLLNITADTLSTSSIANLRLKSCHELTWVDSKIANT